MNTNHSKARKQMLFQDLFENSPIPLWEQDYTAVNKYFNELKQSGITDFEQYFTDRPEELFKCADLIKVTDVNRESVKLFKADSKGQLLKTINNIFTEETLPVFKKSLLSIAAEKDTFESECVLQTLQNDRLVVFLKWSVIGNDVITSTQDITGLKQTEEELKNQQYYLEKAQEIGKVGTWELDLLKNKLIWTDQNYCNFGVPLGTSLNYEIFLDCVHPEDRDYVNTEWMAALKGKPYDIEHRIIKDGEIKWIREKAEVEFDKGGKAIKAIGFTQEITERKLAEETLRESEERYRTLVESTRDGVAITTGDGEFLFVNSRYTSMLGYSSQEELIGTSAIDRYAHPEERAEIFKRLLKYGYVDNQELELLKKNGESIVASFSVVLHKDESGKIIRTEAIVTDITKRKRAEEAFQKISKQNKIILDTAEEGIYGLDLEGKTTFANPASARMIGWEPEDLIGKSQHDVLHHSHADGTHYKREECPIYAALNDGKTHHVDNEVFWRKDGSNFPVDYISTPIRDERDNLVGAVVTFNDITERKLAEKDLRESEEMFSKSFNAHPTPMGIVNIGTGERIDVNKSYLKLMGDSYDDLAIGNMYEKNVAYSQNRMKELISIIQKKGSISNVYYKIVNKSGKIFNTLVSAAKLDIGDGNTTIVSFVDITERMKAEEDLKESEKFSKEIINSTADGFSILDENGVHIDVNPAFCKMTGFTKEELIGTGPPHPYWPEKEYKNIEEAFVKTSQGIFESFELVFKKKNGVRFPVLVNPSQIKDEKGNVKSNFAIVMDLTKRKQAEQALKLSEEKYRAIYSNALVGLFRLSFEEGRVLEANQASAELFGYSSIDEFIKEFKSINHYMNPDDRAPIIQELRDKGYINKIDIHSKKKNGTEIWNRASFCVNNEKDFLDCVSIDITERKRAEKEREILLYNMGERVKEISCLYGVANTIQKSNTLEEILQDVAQLIPPGWQYPDITRCKINFAGKDYVSEPFEESDWVLSSDIVVSDQSKGSIKVYYLEEKPEKDEGSFLKEERSLIDGISGIIMRACERKRAEEGREQALREAENANKVKDLFLANMSHEIRTPLNAILGFSQIIEESFKGRMQESEGEYFKVINSSGQRLIRTVHEVLDISRIEAGVLPYNPEVVRLATPIESICNEFRPAASAKKLEFTYASQVDDGTAKVDKSSVVKAVSNLVDNAIKYTKEGQINIQLNKQNGKYVLSISDTGIGIGEDYLGQIYDAFSQESTGYNKKYQGLGLGLSITKSCLDMNGIPITVESKQGVGTTFSLTFTPADTAIAEPETKTKQVDTKTEKTVSKVKPVVLLVEDEPHNRRALEVTLKDKYETPYAVSVTEAKQQLRKHKVDLIILDLSLEGDEDGLDLVAYMKAKKKLKDIPVIAVTAHAFPRDRDNVFNAGCDDYMSKPIVIKELLGMVSKYLK